MNRLYINRVSAGIRHLLNATLKNIYNQLAAEIVTHEK